MASRGLDYFLNIVTDVNGEKELKNLASSFNEFKKEIDKGIKTGSLNDLEKSLKDFDKEMSKATTKTQSSLNKIGQSFRKFSQQAGKNLQAAGKQISDLGKSFTLFGSTPIFGAAVIGARNFDAQAKAIAQVEAGLKSTGQAAGFTSEQLQNAASALQGSTLFGDEQILKDVTAQLLTFTNIAGEQFTRTQQAAADLATRLDGDLKSATIQLGKALNDPAANLSALSRSGIQFSKDQTTVIKALQRTGRLAEAQTIILNELEKQYGGSAEAAAKAGLGPLKQLGNQLGDLTEDFGKVLLEGLNPFIQVLRELVGIFQLLSPETKTFIAQAALIAAAIGPVAIIIGKLVTGVGVLLKVISTLRVALVGLKGAFIGLGIGALVVGIGFLVNKVIEMRAEFGTLQNVFLVLRQRWELLVARFGLGIKQVQRFVKGLFGDTSAIDKQIDNQRKRIQAIQARNEAVEIGIKVGVKQEEIANLPNQVQTGLQNQPPVEMPISVGDAQKLLDDLKKKTAKTPKEKRVKVPAEFDFLGSVDIAENVNKAQELAAQLSGATNEELSKIRLQGLEEMITATKIAEQSFVDMYDKTRSPEALKNLVEARQRLVDLNQEQAKFADKDLGGQLVDNLGGVDQVAGKLTDTFSEAIEGTKTLGEAFGSLIDDIFQDLTRLALRQAITQGLSSALGGGLPGAFTGGLATASGVLPSYSGGGPVFGQGSSTSDSILALLSNGEFVINAKATRNVGVENLNALNRAFSDNSAQNSKGFQDGGLVNQQDDRNMKVEIINNGTNQEIVRTESRTEGRDYIISIVTQDINRNGPTAQAFQKNFNVRR